MTKHTQNTPGLAPKKKRSGNRKRAGRNTNKNTAQNTAANTSRNSDRNTGGNATGKTGGRTRDRTSDRARATNTAKSSPAASPPPKKKGFKLALQKLFKNPFRKAEKAAEPSQGRPKRAKGGSSRVHDPDAQLEAGKYENPVASRKLILQLIHEHGALTQESLADKLRLTDPDVLEALRRRLIAMTRDGQLIRNRRGGFVPVDEKNLIRGRVIAHPDGFGFLVPDEGGDDLFLSAKQMRSLLHGDRAVVQVAGLDRRGRREGALVEVLERANHSLVGRLHIESSVAFMVADNKRITQDILIPGDKLGDAKAGQIVKVEIVQQPSSRSQPIGKVVGVVGDHMAPGMEIEVAIHSHGLPYEFSAAALSEADALGAEVRAGDKQNRLDLRHLPLVTIDGEDARDFDDAVYCEPIENASDAQWRLLVAIADVAHYVALNSALDKDAYERATSVYFPGRVIPMLPEGISNGLCSLNPEVDRLAMVCEMRLSEDGEIVNYSFHEAVFRSHARLTYNQVASVLVDKDEAESKRLAAVMPHLQNLYGLYHSMAKARLRRGSIDFDSTETKITFNIDQRIESINPTVRNDAHKIIEECMIAANICAATFIAKHKLPTLYRVHDSPGDEKLEDLRGFLKDLGLRLGEPQRKIESSDYAQLTSEIADRDDKHLIQMLLLRSMRQAMYKPENVGHFGLALDNYAHFTSPIRRYPDLLVHRAIKHIVRKLPLRDFAYDMKRMGTMGEHCSANERRADEATRDAELALKCEYMLDKIGQEFKATVTSVVSFGLFVEIDDLYVEGLVHITSLPKDFYQFNPATHQLVGERHGLVFNLRDKVKVRVTRVDMDERKLDFELV